MEPFRQFGKFCSPADDHQKYIRVNGYHAAVYLIEGTGLVAYGRRFLNDFGPLNAIQDGAAMSN
jgi:hypothetical protein